MWLFRVRLRLPHRSGRLAELTESVLAELTESVSAVQVVQVRVGRSHDSSVVADATLQARDPAAMNEIVRRAGQHSPWVQLVPLPALIDDDMDVPPRLSSGCLNSEDPAVTDGHPRYHARSRVPREEAV